MTAHRVGGGIGCSGNSQAIFDNCIGSVVSAVGPGLWYNSCGVMPQQIGGITCLSNARLPSYLTNS